MNRLRATVAGALGYEAGATKEADRRKFMERADSEIKRIANSNPDGDSAPYWMLVKNTMVGIRAFDDEKDAVEREMVKLAKELPVASWVNEPEQRGFGILMLALVIGETGDLFNYSNPAKVWRRMGCAPHTYEGKTLMGATWKSGKEGRLPADEWKRYGYCPRRRSLAYLIGEGLVKHNKSIYRQRYDEAKALAAKKHPDWIKCRVCGGTGKTKRGSCSNCRGTGKVMKRCHLHAMLLASKLLLKNLWIEWNR